MPNLGHGAQAQDEDRFRDDGRHCGYQQNPHGQSRISGAAQHGVDDIDQHPDERAKEGDAQVGHPQRLNLGIGAQELQQGTCQRQAEGGQKDRDEDAQQDGLAGRVIGSIPVPGADAPGYDRQATNTQAHRGTLGEPADGDAHGDSSQGRRAKAADPIDVE